MNLSIVTVAMNRTQHLQQQARAVSGLRVHSEHIILDYGSTKPLRRDQLPGDDRIRLHRVESPNGRWWLTHAYNLAFALASSDYILKLDADVLPARHFMHVLAEQQASTGAHFMCNRLTLQDWSLPSELFTTNGLFLCKKTSLAQVGGFNPYIQGWGWDEIDLYSRLFFAGFPVSRIPQDGLKLINHDNNEREHPLSAVSPQKCGLPKATIERVTATRRMRAQNEKNRHIAVASINNQIRWPSFEDYAKTYRDHSRLPALSQISLFNSKEIASLVAGLRHQLLDPSRMQNLRWKVAKKFGFGPYASRNTKELLAACNIDLSLFV